MIYKLYRFLRLKNSEGGAVLVKKLNSFKPKKARGLRV